MNSDVLWAEALGHLRRRSVFLERLAEALEPSLARALVGAYLAFRAVDDVEDAEGLAVDRRVATLEALATALRRPDRIVAVEEIVAGEPHLLPVSHALGRWLALCPAELREATGDTTATFCARAAGWARRGWRIGDEQQLERYVDDVAGAVMLLLGEIWRWADATPLDAEAAVHYARYVQAVDLAYDRDDDLARGVDLFPPGWATADMIAFAHRYRAGAERYLDGVAGGAGDLPTRALLDLSDERALLVTARATERHVLV